MSELLREIEEDIRNERIRKVWRAVSKVMVQASVLVVLGTIGIVTWQHYSQSRAMEQTSRFMKGIDRLGVEDYRGAIAAFDELSADKGTSYYALAMLHKGQAEELSGDREAARKTYDALARSGASDENFTVLASLLAVSDSDALLPAPGKDTPFAYTRSEWRAWQLLKQGKRDEAVAIFTELSDDERVPYSLRARASEVLSHLGAVSFAEESHE